MIVLDWETRSRVDLRAEGGWRYAESAASEIVCGVALDTRTDPATVYAWSPFEVGELKDWHLRPDYLRQLNTPADALHYTEPLLGSDEPPEPVLAAARKGVPFLAHNAWGFDEIIWEELGLPEARWLDSMPRARRRGLPAALDRLGQTLYGLGKDKAGRRVMELTMKPMARGKCRECGGRIRRGGCAKCGAPPPFLDPDAGRLSAIVRYCLRDVMLLAAAWFDEGLGEPHPDDATLEACRMINRRGLLVDLQAVADLQRVEAKHVAAAEDEACAATRGEVTPTTLRSPIALKRWLEGRGCDVPDTAAPTLAAELKRTDLDEATRVVLTSRLAVARVTGGKTQAAERRVCRDGRLRAWAVYWGAHTGRWAGRGFQPHNLPRPVEGLPEDIHDTPDEAPRVAAELGVDTCAVLGSMLRGLLVAPHLFAIVDYASVEARGLLWCAGDEEGLEVYRAYDAGTGPDAYKAAAAGIYGSPIVKITKPERQVGKIAVLSLGYQGGPAAFERMAKGKVNIVGLSLTQIVESWRDARPLVAGQRRGLWTTPEGKIVVTRRGGLWRDLKAAAWRAIQTRDPVEAGRCTWSMEGAHLICTLPSGRPLVYREARIEYVESRWGTTVQAITYQSTRWKAGAPMRIPTYGGKLAENIVQAICRDLLADSLVRLEAAGLPVVLHVHDEAVVEISDSEQLAEVERIMRDAPAWAAGMPVEVSGNVARRYGK